jgi:hypothetical protein
MSPTETTEDTYRTMSTRVLVLLRAAFELDRRDAALPETVAFCDDRLAIIARVLRERGE